MNVTISNVRFSAGGREIIRGANAMLPHGRISVIIGDNGSGKSTLLKLAAGLLTPGSGTVRYGDGDIAAYSVRELARRRAILLQHPKAPETMTAGELLTLSRYAFDAGRSADARAVGRALDETGCADLLPRTLGTLSGGELRKIFLTLALAQEPELLLLDEVEAGLDAGFRTGLPALLEYLRTERGLTIVMVMHDLDLALHCADKIIGMRSGETVLDIGMDAPDAAEKLTAFTENRYEFFSDASGHPRALPRFAGK